MNAKGWSSRWLREQGSFWAAALVAFLAFSLMLGAVVRPMIGVPLVFTGVVVAMLIGLLVYAIRSGTVRQAWGRVVAVLCGLVALQAFHTLEHLAQWVQFHMFGWPAREASGLVSAANVEAVHFLWNWMVLCVVVYLMRGGLRGIWMWLLFGWALAHSLEHTYLFVRYLYKVQELRLEGISTVFAQGLPGIFGRHGWLADSPITRETFLCTLPGLTTAPRLDVHFWWNTVETALLFGAALAGFGQISRAARFSPDCSLIGGARHV